ncbi:GNAT family N-acetyltransferase [Streptomyces fulvorobeus]|uniref:RimJ/RimL family protein N-acetyltransferase n=1 Tax=Streptomyces fulvorobeus TaxID=284028 RepID=A0A7Y9KW78_9ACTN|nr:GNAT family protein [Streptomyces fulvorobeus]NYE43961.1 RimJ/RimL family protein N-acetyltransferase [Streptomyces fulvorobeus]
MSEDTAEPDTVREPCWRGRTIRFTPVETDDAELIQRWRFDPVTAHETGVWPASLYELRERIERHHDDSSRDDFLVLLPDGTPVGHAALIDQQLAEGSAQAYLVLAPEHRGEGHGADALDALMDLAFGELPLQRVEAHTHTGNAPALRVLAGAGFVHEGVRRSACLHRGRRHDISLLSLLRPEWEARDRPRSWDHV